MSDKNNITVIEVPVKRTPCPCGVSGYGTNDKHNTAIAAYQDTSTVFEEDGRQVTYLPMTIKGREYQYVPFGAQNMLPYTIRDRIMENMVAAQCQSFNVLACYGQGVRFVDRQTKVDVDNEEISRFCLANSLTEVFLEQATDMKFFFFSVTVIILDRRGDRIVTVRNKDAMNCRFEYAPSTKSGNIEHVFYGDFRVGHFEEEQIEVIPLLDFWNPLGDLNVRMGNEPDPKTGIVGLRQKERKFAIVSRMATPGCQYYPMPYYMSIFKDSWYDIYELIGIGKKHLIRNTSAPRIQIEVHNEYWDNLCDAEGIIDEVKRKQRKEQEKQQLIDYCTGVLNAGKAIVSGYWVDPNGKENRMVRINVLNDRKTEGGDWSDDMSEASNSLCFAFGVHPNLVGATPGKSQMNNSGSDKRELFTLKQALEKPFHDVMCKPYHVILHYNNWHTFATVDVPMIQLTTLDENKDAKEVTNSNGKEEESDD